MSAPRPQALGDPPAPDEARIRLELIRSLFSHSPLGQYGALGVALVAAAVFWRTSGAGLTLGWLGFMLLTVLLRLWLVRCFHERGVAELGAARRWEQGFLWATLVSALGWGASGWLFFDDTSLAHQFFLMAIVAGISAGAVPVLAPSPPAASGFLIAAITPVSLRLFIAGGDTNVGLGLLTLLYLGILLMVARRTWQLLRHSIELSVENRALVEVLSERALELERHNDRIRAEQEIALSVFNAIVPQAALDRSGLVYHLSSHSLFNGDLLLAADRPDGCRHFLLGDFTGHGLAGSLGALPVSDIFQGMTRKGYGIDAIAMEINGKLQAQLPSSLFLAACLVEIDDRHGLLRVWNGGTPGAYLLAPGGGLLHRFESRHLPLGIVEGGDFEPDCERWPIEPGQRLFLATDGVIEQQNPDGEMYGERRLEALLQRSLSAAALAEALRADLERFSQGAAQTDDLTFMIAEVREPQAGTRPGTATADGAHVHWQLHCRLEADALRLIQPVPVLYHSVREFERRHEGLETLELVLGELFSNALDHGVLGLDSALKAEPGGFERYYAEREAALARLGSGHVEIRVSGRPLADGQELVVEVADSGKGFPVPAGRIGQGDAELPFGRGLRLVQSLSRELVFAEEGRRVRAVLHLG